MGTFLDLSEQARIVDRQGHLVGQRLQNADILLTERLWFGALHVKNTDDRAARAQRQGHLGPRLGQVGVVQECGVLTHI